jgi:hypothetical protein
MVRGRFRKIATQRLELDYVAPVRRPRWPGLALLVFAVCLAALLFSRYRDARLEVLRLSAQGGIAVERPLRALPRERLDDETRAAEAVVRQLTVPWAALLGAIEQTATRDVAILQLQPDVEQGLLRLTAEARRREAMFEYLRRLSAARGIAEVHLVSHQVQENDPQRPIQFAVQAAMREAR